MKGLTWDPVGKYIASQADDRSLKVWRTLDWQLETSITKPFDEVRAHSPPPTRPRTASGAGPSCGAQPWGSAELAVPFPGAVKQPPAVARPVRLGAEARAARCPQAGWRPRRAGTCGCRPLPWGRAASAGPWRPCAASTRATAVARVLLSLASLESCLHAGPEWGVAVVWETLPRLLRVCTLLCPAVLVQGCPHPALGLCLVGLPPRLHSLGPSRLGLRAAQG